MVSVSDNNQAYYIDAFTCTAIYLDDLFNIDNPYLELMVGQVYTTELQLNKANAFDTEDPFSGLDLSVTKDIVSSQICYKGEGLNSILQLLITHFLMEMFLASLPMVYNFSNLFVLREYFLM